MNKLVIQILPIILSVMVSWQITAKIGSQDGLMYSPEIQKTVCLNDPRICRWRGLPCVDGDEFIYLHPQCAIDGSPRDIFGNTHICRHLEFLFSAEDSMDDEHPHCQAYQDCFLRGWNSLCIEKGCKGIRSIRESFCTIQHPYTLTPSLKWW